VVSVIGDNLPQITVTVYFAERSIRIWLSRPASARHRAATPRGSLHRVIYRARERERLQERKLNASAGTASPWPVVPKTVE
jgi:hypothetical protein